MKLIGKALVFGLIVAIAASLLGIKLTWPIFGLIFVAIMTDSLLDIFFPDE